MENRTNTGRKVEQEMLELNEQFSAFLHTKGIGAKFRVAIENMGQSAHQQHEADKANFEAVKARSAEDNKEFAEFLHTKGIKSKYNLVVGNIKKSAKAASHDTAVQIAKIHAKTQEAVARANAHGNPHGETAPEAYTAASLADEFNAFLKLKGLDGKYTVSVTEE